MPTEIDEGGSIAVKQRLFFLLILIFLVGCQAPCQTEAPDYAFEAPISHWERELEEASPQAIQLQQELARWYNYRLSNGMDCQQAYESILFYTDGILGTVEFPSLDLQLPIYHGTEAPALGHEPTSAFPIGEAGNHSVLVTELPISLEAGDVYLIHIPGSVLTYQVVTVRTQPDTTSVPEMAYCSILVSGEYQILAIRTRESA